MPTEPNDALAETLLVLRAQMGARDAYAALVERYDARLLFYLRRVVGPSSDAEDVRQNVWLTVVRKLHTLECRVGTVRSRIHYAKTALRAAVSKCKSGGIVLPKERLYE